jgi:DNA-binding NtrC family response regulator
MRAVYAQVEKLAASDVKTFIQGENGTGKELIARALHHSGPRSRQPFVTLDCSTIPEGLVESHLFGHVRGAFTGAVSTRPGVFARAHGGTLFVDEIAELPPRLQSRLLRVLESGEFTMVGRNRPERADVRTITATNQDLSRAVAEGRFRPDLYFRIAVARIELPPLRERPEDVPLLATHFLQACTAKYGRERLGGLTARGLRALIAYSWPGNVRQLENWIENAVILAEEQPIDLQHFPELRRQPPPTPAGFLPPGLTLIELERRYIAETLDRTGGDRVRAAEILGISVRRLQDRLATTGFTAVVDRPRPAALTSRHGAGPRARAAG